MSAAIGEAIGLVLGGRVRRGRGGGRGCSEKAAATCRRLACAGLAGLVLQPLGAGAAGLPKRLQASLEVPGLNGAAVTALVVERESGAVLFARQPDRPLVPASNQKVLTAVAALSRFGPAHQFETEVLTSAPLDGTGAVPMLYVRGGGDPTLTSEEWWRLASDLRLEGLRRVSGAIRLDESLFDDQRWHPSWGDPTARAYHAPVGALMANYGAFQVRVRPRLPGQSAEVLLDPPVPYLTLDARVQTVAGDRRELEVSRVPQAMGDRVVVRGRIGSRAEAREIWRSVSQPARYAGHVLRRQLEATGIVVDGDVEVGPVPGTAVPFHVHEGRPLAEIVRLFLKYSTNVIAESLLKSLGVEGGTRPGSFAAGTLSLRAALGSAGLSLDGHRFVDGSGLSRGNQVSARLLVETLRLADRSFRIGPELTAGLPIAAADGTLEKRALGAVDRVRAKTGLLSGATSLSGYARSPGGREVVFSVIVNGYAGSDRAAMDALDGFAAALARD
ncbi:MAG: D-alanyl-D-alanine carboxypeptidase/D-alanyl-D-alanine-endopeptidase [Myxococcota bacterium]|nr:D-alanyl-D-alanine carboxypeptidase/D-alanyl-D-alanine-endopeptidase [Myxococcota bacterium]